jgi:hypothetical protein
LFHESPYLRPFRYWPIRKISFFLSGFEWPIKTGEVLPLECQSPLPPLHRLAMLHTHHHVSFFRNSSVYSPHQGVVLSCVAFHHYVVLSEADADLCWANDLCFSCRLPGHRAECCPRSFCSERLTCSLLDNPTSKSCFVPSWTFLVIDYWTSVGRS